MQVPDIPEPNDLLKEAIPLLGPMGVVLALYFAIKAVLSWVEAARKAVELGRSAHSFAARHFTRLSQQPRSYRLLGLFLTFSTMIIQLFWAYLAFIMGNGLSQTVGASPVVDLSTLSVSEFVAGLTWDWVSASYMTLCAIALIHAYRSPRAKNHGMIAGFLAAPAFPIALSGTLGATLILADYLGASFIFGNKFTQGQVVLGYLIGVLSISFILATRAALRSPGLLARYWTKPVRLAERNR